MLIQGQIQLKQLLLNEVYQGFKASDLCVLAVRGEHEWADLGINYIGSAKQRNRDNTEVISLYIDKQNGPEESDFIDFADLTIIDLQLFTAQFKQLVNEFSSGKIDWCDVKNKTVPANPTPEGYVHCDNAVTAMIVFKFKAININCVISTQKGWFVPVNAQVKEILDTNSAYNSDKNMFIGLDSNKEVLHIELNKLDDERVYRELTY